MQKPKQIRKLTLGRETLRELDPREAEAPAGGFLSSNYISCIGCQTTKTC